jgi:hypothetical protein
MRGTTLQDRGSQQLRIRRCYRCSEILGVEFDNTSYDSYVGVAQALYKYMLRLVHTVWSRNSHMYGYSYDIVANNSTLVKWRTKTHKDTDNFLVTVYAP